MNHDRDMNQPGQGWLPNNTNKTKGMFQKKIPGRDLYQALFNNPEEAIIVFDGLAIVDANQCAVNLLSINRNQLTGLRPSAISPEHQPDGSSTDTTLESKIKLASQNGSTRFDWVLQRTNGETYVADTWLVTVRLNDKNLVCAMLRDISQQKKTEQHLRNSLQKLSLHVMQSPLAVIDWDTRFHVIGWNPAAERIFGYSEEEALGQHASFIVPEIYHELVDGIMRDLLEKRGGTRSTNDNITKDGKTISCEWYNTPIIDASGNVLSISSLAQDISDQVRYIHALQHQAHHDYLTGLYNRNWLIERLETWVRDESRHSFCLYFIDLDRFREINDTLGHDIGDELLITISKRLSEHMHLRNYEVARLGGDEFAVLAEKGNIADISLSIMDTLNQPVELSGMSLEIRAGIGIACYPLHGRDPTTLMRCADIAMYNAKDTASNYVTYSREIDTYSPERLTLMSELSSAIQDNQLRLYFQPKIDIARQKHVGYEALLRWEHPQRGMVLPEDFVPYAEITEMIHPLTAWVIDNALRQWKTWHEQGQHFNLSINLSTHNLLDDRLPQLLAQLLKRYEVDPTAIELEITESAVMHRPEYAMTVLKKLHDLGVLLSIDDFGTGYSSLTYLRQLPIHKLKIDQAFVTGMNTNHEDRIIVQSTIGLAHNLGLKVIAEGVENKALMALLDGLGCDEAQGYFIAQPLPIEKLEHWQYK